MKAKKPKILLCLLLITIMIFSFSNLCFAADTIYTRQSAPAGWQANTDPNNVFKINSSDPTVAGKGFILLNTNNTSDSSRFFIMTQNHYGRHSYHNAVDANQIDPLVFDPNDQNSIAYWLNNSFINNGNTDGAATYRLPSQIISHIDSNHVWQTESYYWNTTIKHDYSSKCGLAVMSGTEWSTYKLKFGYIDDTPTSAWVGWWLRTALYQSGINHILYSMTSDNPPGDRNKACQNDLGYSNTSLAYVRPVFYLNKSFFTDVKVNLASLGSNVKAAIKATYSSKELLTCAAGYTESEVYDTLGYPRPPIATNVSINNKVEVGNTLTGTYLYDAQGGLSEFGTTFRWLISDTYEGPYTAISQQTNNTYTVQIGDIGKFLKFEVTPKSSADMLFAAYTSSQTIQVNPYSMDQCAYTSKDGISPPTLKAGGSLKVTANITNRTGAEGHAVMIVEVYDKNNLLQAIGMDEKALTNANPTLPYVVSMDITKDIDTPKVYVYVLDDLSTGIPLTDANIYSGQ